MLIGGSTPKLIMHPHGIRMFSFLKFVSCLRKSLIRTPSMDTISPSMFERGCKYIRGYLLYWSTSVISYDFMHCRLVLLYLI